MARILEKPVFRGFQGVVPPDLPPSGGLTATGFPYDEILSKWGALQKTRSVYLWKHGHDSWKTSFQGVVPPEKNPSGLKKIRYLPYLLRPIFNVTQVAQYFVGVYMLGKFGFAGKGQGAGRTNKLISLQANDIFTCFAISWKIFSLLTYVLTFFVLISKVQLKLTSCNMTLK